jgi:hypothetical protein
MKPKLIFCLALVLSGGLFGCSKTKPTGQTTDTVAVDADAWVLPKQVQGEIWNKTLLTNWTDTKITLYRANGDVVQLNAKKAIYRIWTTNNWANNHSSLDMPVVAFIDPLNGKIWLGSADTDKDFKISDFYVENDSGIFGVRSILFAGTFNWHKSLIAKANPNEDVNAVINRFERSINGWWLLERWEQTSFSSYFREWFFYPHVTVSFIGATAIDHNEVASGKLRLDFTSPAYKTKGSVWLDLKTWKVLKAVEYKYF